MKSPIRWLSTQKETLKMSHIITLHNNQPTVSHRVIADGTGNHPQNIKELMDDYKSDFEEFGVIRFETEKGKGRPTVTYYLNESQATLLLTYLRNSTIVRAFKVALVKEFYKMREELYQKQPEITIVNTTDKERLGTLESQVYMLKNENRELRRAMNRMLYNENHTQGVQLGEYSRLSGNKGIINVFAVEKGVVHFTERTEKHEVGVEKFMTFFRKAPKLLK